MNYLDVEAGRLVAPAVIVIEDGKISDINPSSRPTDARTIELGAHTLLPGLMDAHTHLNYELIKGWDTEPIRFTAGDFALRAVPNAKSTLLAGFTTVRDLGTGYGFSDVALMRAIDKGLIIGSVAARPGNTGSACGPWSTIPCHTRKNSRTQLARMIIWQ